MQKFGKLMIVFALVVLVAIIPSFSIVNAQGAPFVCTPSTFINVTGSTVLTGLYVVESCDAANSTLTISVSLGGVSAKVTLGYADVVLNPLNTQISQAVGAYGASDQDWTAINAALNAALLNTDVTTALATLNLKTVARTDQFTLVYGSNGIVLGDLAGISNFEVPAGSSTLFVAALPNGVTTRGENISGVETGKVMVSFSAEPAAASVQVHIRALYADGSLVEVVNGVTTRDVNIGRLNGAIHHALYQQELTTDEPVGYLVEFINPGAAVTTFRFDHNPERGAVADVNIAAWTPGS